MSQPGEADPYKQWQADSRILWRLAILVALLGLAGCNALWLHARRSTRFFSFEAFEGNGSAPQIEEARYALQRIVPRGSELADYDRFFKEIGGGCSLVADVVRFPDEAVCWYDHGFLISAGWRYVIYFDPATKRSTRTEMNFGLTGP